MDKILIMLLILPTIYAKIAIDIFATDEKHNVRVTGGHTASVTTTELNTFNLKEDTLKKLIGNYFGSVPDSVHTKSPSLWGDLFKTMNWKPVKRVVKPKHAESTSFNTEPVLVLTKELYNDKTEEVTLRTEMLQYITNTFSTKWTVDANVDAQDIIYHIDSKTPSPYISFTGKWGEDLEKYLPMTVGSEIEVKLAPKQKIQAELYVDKEEMVVKVDYETSLSGHVVANFDKQYKGHKFWSMDVNTLLTSGGMRNVVESSEMVEFVQFTNAKVLVKDALTKEVMFTVSLKVW